MAGILEVVNGNTRATSMQFQESGTPLSITGFTIQARVGTPTTTVINATIVDAVNGEAKVAFGTIAAGTYPAELVITDTNGSQTSERFTLNVRAPL